MLKSKYIVYRMMVENRDGNGGAKKQQSTHVRWKHLQENNHAALRTYQACPGAIYRWLKLVGFTYEAQRKGYYVDGHEKPATVTYHKDFVNKYLSEEVQIFHWIQIEQEEAEKL